MNQETNHNQPDVTETDYSEWMEKLDQTSGTLSSEEQADFGSMMDRVEQRSGPSEAARFHMMLLSKYQELSHEQDFMATLIWGMKTIRWLGLLLIVLTLVDFVLVLLDLQLKNPMSELTVVGSLTSHTTVAIIGVVFFFIGGEHERTGLEKRFSGILSWVVLLIGGTYILLAPLMVMNQIRVAEFQSKQLENSKETNLKQLKIQHDKLLLLIKTPENLRTLQQKLTGSNDPINTEQEFKAAKSNILNKMSLQKDQIINRLNKKYESVRQKQNKSTTKTVISLLLFGLAFIFIWRTSAWARVK